jgi:hypothetical protein
MSASSLRRQILLSSTMLMGALTGYGGRAYAQVVCTQVGATSTYHCSGSSVDPQTVNHDNANVVVEAPGLIVNTPANADALYISGAGAISFTDPFSFPNSYPAYAHGF